MRASKNFCTCLWLAALCTLVMVEPQNGTSLPYKTLTYNINVADKESYSHFLQSVRDHLSSGFRIHGIPVLHNSSSLPNSQRFLLINLSNSITLAMDITNANTIAFGVKNKSYFFNDALQLSFTDLFTNTQQNRLPFGSSYVELENVTGQPRSNIDLGLIALQEAICGIGTQNTNYMDLASHLIVVMQMVSEAAKFRRIEQQVRWSSQNNQTFRPDAYIRWLENNWKTLSAAIQGSKNGVFPKQVVVQLPNLEKFNLYSVNRELVANLAFMIFINCKDNSTLSDEGDCPTDFEPTVRIVGRDGLCVDAKDEMYHDGNPVHMWQCKTNASANQLWTFKRDGTIQSKGKCLTANPYNPEGNNVTTNDCQTAMPNATRWAVWDNGTIINPQFGLVLTAKSGGEGGMLVTLEKNIYASSQGFQCTNNTWPFALTIVGFNDLCLQATGKKVWVSKCDNYNPEQKWVLIADGSIRPRDRLFGCLTSGWSTAPGTILTIGSCKFALPGHRWWFRSSGIFFHLHSLMVMDVKMHNPSLQQIIIWPPNGRSNQKWLPLF